MENLNQTPTLSRAWYRSSVPEFLESASNAILGELTRNSEFNVDESQIESWLEEIEFLKKHLVALEGVVFLEFNIPRMGSRVDAVLLIASTVFVIEFMTADSRKKSLGQKGYEGRPAA